MAKKKKGGHGSEVPKRAVRPLSPRELEVMKELAHARGHMEISKRLKIEPTTVRNHIQNILRKLVVHSKLAAVVYAYRNRIVEIPPK